MGDKKYTTIEEVIALSRIESVSISEDGKCAAYVKKTTDWKENTYRSHIWIYEKESKKHYPMTTGKNESSNPAWAPVNNYLAYTAEVGEKDSKHKQIFLRTLDEFNGVQITNCKESIDKFKWSSDGKGIFFTVSEEDSEELKNRKEIYGDFEYIDKEYKNNTLQYIEIDEAIKSLTGANNKPKSIDKKDEEDESKDISIQLTNPRNFNIAGFDISEDGKKAVLVCTKTSYIKDDDTDIYLLDIETKDIKKLKIDGIIFSQIAFSPDGRKIAYSKTAREKEYYKTRVYDQSIMEIYDLEKDERTMRLSQLDKDTTVIKWTSKGILITWQDRTRFLAGIVSEKGELYPLYNDNTCFILDAAITSDGENTAYVKVSQNENFEVYLNGTRITNESSIYDNKTLSHKELITWRTSDGLEIEGVLSKPQDFNSETKYPLLVVIHGGPTWASFPIHNMNRLYPIEQFVEKGFIVLEPNYRGSSGYGSEFFVSNYRMLGIGDYEDVISGVDMLINKGIADKDKVGVMGWSQGGYISAFCSTYSNRFKAISVGAGISNWVTYYVNTDITTFTRSYLGDNPWEDPEIYAKTSPMAYIKNACTPTLIQHGDKDARVPVPNAFELYRGLQDMGVESELVIYKGMGHSPTKPGIHRAIMEQNLEWFTKHINI